MRDEQQILPFALCVTAIELVSVLDQIDGPLKLRPPAIIDRSHFLVEPE
jgi:hypothetical protein